MNTSYGAETILPKQSFKKVATELVVIGSCSYMSTHITKILLTKSIHFVAKKNCSNHVSMIALISGLIAVSTCAYIDHILQFNTPYAKVACALGSLIRMTEMYIVNNNFKKIKHETLLTFFAHFAPVFSS